MSKVETINTVIHESPKNNESKKIEDAKAICPRNRLKKASSNLLRATWNLINKNFAK
jgi:hypothetical protein